MKKVTEVLRDNGFKVTPQRLAVYQVLSETREHPNAEMLFDKLQPQYPMMSLATVYKTIEIFSQLNLIKILNTGEDSFRYDADVSEHGHIKCGRCNVVKDVLDIDLTSITNEVQEKTGYTIDSKQVYFFGTCPECRKKEAN